MTHKKNKIKNSRPKTREQGQGQGQTPSTGLRHPSKVPESGARSVGQGYKIGEMCSLTLYISVFRSQLKLPIQSSASSS